MNKYTMSAAIVMAGLVGTSGVQASVLDDLGLTKIAGIKWVSSLNESDFLSGLTGIVQSSTAFGELTTLLGSSKMNVTHLQSAPGANDYWHYLFTLSSPGGVNTVNYSGQTIVAKAPGGGPVDGSSGSLAAPGPIAGAGLPLALALMGYAAWRRRYATV